MGFGRWKRGGLVSRGDSNCWDCSGAVAVASGERFKYSMVSKVYDNEAFGRESDNEPCPAHVDKGAMISQ